MNLAILNIIAGCFLSSSLILHPVHVAVINVDIPNDRKEIDITFKFFTNDIELAVVHNFNVPLNLGMKDEKTENLKYLNNYIVACFALKADQKNPLPLQFKRKEITDDATWLYYTAPLTGNFRELSVKNTVLLDIYEDQTNLVIIAHNGKEKGFRMNYKEQKIDYQIP